MPSENNFINRTRNYPIAHMYSLSSKRESTQKKKCDLLSDNGSSKEKSHKDNISYYNNTSNNRAKIESGSVKKIIEKISNENKKNLIKIKRQNVSLLDSLNSLLYKYFKKQ